MKKIILLYCVFLISCGRGEETNSEKNKVLGKVKFNTECFRSLNSVKFYNTHRKMIYIKTSESSCSQCINNELDIISAVKKNYGNRFFIITTNKSGVNDLYYQYLLKYNIPVFEFVCYKKMKLKRDSCQLGYMMDSVLYPILTFPSYSKNSMNVDKITNEIDIVLKTKN